MKVLIMKESGLTGTKTGQVAPDNPEFINYATTTDLSILTLEIIVLNLIFLD